MTDLNQIAAFVAVIRHGGFTLAAKELGEPKSTLSRKVSELEKRLGASLMVRTTRSIRLTEAGQRFYDESARLLYEMESAEKALLPHQLGLQGLIRMTAPVEVGTHLLPQLLSEFMQKYPKIDIELDLSDRYVDLLREGFDIALRAGHLKDSSFRAKKLGVGCFSLFASPVYIKKNSLPQKPQDVTNHKCIVFSPEFRNFPWTMQFQGLKEKIIPKSQIRVNSLTMAKNLASSGAGISYLPTIIVEEELRKKDLVAILPEWQGDLRPYYLIYPQTKLAPLRIRLILDFLADRLKI